MTAELPSRAKQYKESESEQETVMENGKKNSEMEKDFGTAYGITLEALNDLNSEKDGVKLEELKGVTGLARLVRSSLESGLPAADETDVAARKAFFGANVMPEPPVTTLLELLWEALQDPTLILLMCAATISVLLGSIVEEEREEHGWADGVAIWVAVIVVSVFGAVNDYQKNNQFRSLNSAKDQIDVKVIRGGEEMLIASTDILVGDLMVVDTGDKFCADGIYVRGFDMVVDEASLTGESEPIKKGESEQFCRSGTQVTEGSGVVLIVAVGEHSEWGHTLALVVKEHEDTPLQEKLGDLANNIGYVGFAVALCCFISLTGAWIAKNNGFPSDVAPWNEVLHFFLLAVTIVVVAVPEGLPLAVTISLAYSMKKMMSDNNLVRFLAACETMGGATQICSDKTGTLTENRMTVVEGWFAGKKETSMPPTLSAPVVDCLARGIALNSKAFLVPEEDGRISFVGNRTECALLMLQEKLQTVSDIAGYKQLRRNELVEKIYAFTSDRKMASVLVPNSSGKTLYCKGAAELVLEKCACVMNEQGVVDPMTPGKKAELESMIQDMASRGLRCICLAVRDFEPAALASIGDEFFDKAPESDMTCISIVGIKDPLRGDVSEAVKTCQDAGIVVRMVTGDNVLTAKHIATECGILTDGIAMEGPTFRAMLGDEAKLNEVLPKLQVLARSTPQDKYELVRALKNLGEVVAVTGDGTNDAPALSESDVGLSMGLSGTEVAKEASDIIILDDRFSSIVRAVLWGRSVFNNIRKFLQFQITINLVALTVAFVAAIVSSFTDRSGTPLNVLQLLWVNLIMDSMAALALATEDPDDSLLRQKPNGRDEPLISPKMWKHIVVQGIYQLIVIFFLIYALPDLGIGYDLTGKDEFVCGVSPIDDTVTLTLDGFPKRDPDVMCGEGVETCDTLVAMQSLHGACDDAYEDLNEDEEKKINSLVFNAFIMCQLFNEINARKVSDELNVFQRILDSRIFFYVIVGTAASQAVIMELLGDFFHVRGQSAAEWGAAIAIGFAVMPIAFVTKILTPKSRGIAPL
mmetsp:Transcript_8941/g.29390  ORF Transcript_8941/g.29390 Transcript_8941/m.29390 type:complete len:1038 (+) Transcript_8941:510-3623(+)